MSPAVLAPVRERDAPVVDRFRTVTPELLTSIQEMFRQLPLLRLTLESATRLWNRDALTCHVALRTLVGDGALVERGGVFLKSGGWKPRA